MTASPPLRRRSAQPAALACRPAPAGGALARTGAAAAVAAARYVGALCILCLAMLPRPARGARAHARRDARATRRAVVRARRLAARVSLPALVAHAAGRQARTAAGADLATLRAAERTEPLGA